MGELGKMRTTTKQGHSSSEPSRNALITATAHLLANDLPIKELFEQAASLMSDAFGTASVEISVAGDAPYVYRYGVDAAFELGTSVTLPLMAHANEIGTFRVVRNNGEQFSPAELACLETVALNLASRLNEAEITSEKDHYAALAGIDPLTGIPSRREFTARFESEWSRGVRQGGLLSVLMIDVDLFKQYNDCHGHIAGDECLHLIAQVLAHNIARPGDTVARYGGEEFAVILPQTDNAGAVALAEKMRSAVAAQRVVHGASPREIVTVSVGAATQTPLQSTASLELLELADMALYTAKQSGRNMVVGDQYRTDLAHTGKPPIQTNLPPVPSKFFGRMAELDAIEYLFTQTRALTITGIAGIGKTRVALEFARRTLQNFPDGVWFVDIARITDAELVVGSVMYVLSQNEEPGKQPVATLVRRIGERRMLIVLDNCQRLIEECATLAEALLRKCPNVAIIATCRQPLGIATEIAYRTPPLAYHDAADLFVARALSVNPSAEIRDADKPIVDRIVARLNAIPMAIELAAARIKVMTVGELDKGLNERFPVLLPGGEAAPSREHILPALVDWKYLSLDDAEKRVLRMVAVFPGEFTFEACQAVSAERPGDKQEEFPVLDTLVEKAFLFKELHETVPRYIMFETLREYCRRVLDENNEAKSIQARHAAFYLQLAERLEAQRAKSSAKRWKASVEIEHHNFRAALEWSVLESGDVVVGTALVVALAPWWTETAHFTEGHYWIDHVIWRANDGNVGADLYARLLAAAVRIDSRDGARKSPKIMPDVVHVAV
jgi:diguanylate cyclase (GGDEF)-like protein